MQKAYSSVFALALGAILVLSVMTPGRAAAQFLDPRAGQAIAICNSPMGASVPECAQLRAATGGGGLAGGAASAIPGIGGLLGVAAGVARGEQGPPGTTAVYNACLARSGNNASLRATCDAQRNAAIAGAAPRGNVPAGTPAASPYASQAVQQQYVDCVQRAGVNQQALMACGMALQSGVNLPPMALGPQGSNTAVNIASNGQAYRDCITRMGSQPMGATACSALLNAPAGSLPGSLPPGANTNYNPPAPGFPGAQVPNAPQPGKPFDPLAF